MGFPRCPIHGHIPCTQSRCVKCDYDWRKAPNETRSVRLVHAADEAVQAMGGPQSQPNPLGENGGSQGPAAAQGATVIDFARARSKLTPAAILKGQGYE